MGQARPSTGHAPQGLAAERLARAKRQAEFNQNFPGTPVPPSALAQRAPNRGGRSNGAL